MSGLLLFNLVQYVLLFWGSITVVRWYVRRRRRARMSPLEVAIEEINRLKEQAIRDIDKAVDSDERR